jgi:hypothetical protein
MKEYKNDTSADYDDLVDYIAEENKPSNLKIFLDEDDDEEYRLAVKAKEPDKDFPEKWQNLYVNFRDFEDYKKFMLLIGKKPLPNLKDFVFSKEADDEGIFSFCGDD